MELEKTEAENSNIDLLGTMDNGYVYSLYGSKLTPTNKQTMDLDELIETYNLIMKALGEAGILNVGSH